MSSTCLGDERILLAVDLTLFAVLPCCPIPVLSTQAAALTRSQPVELWGRG